MAADRLSPSAPSALFGLTGKVGIVTGASTGLGLATARVLAAAGASLLMCARTAERLQAAVSGVVADGGRATGRADDIARDGAAADLVAAAVDAYGRLDFLVNNAAIVLPRYATEDIPAAEWDRVMATNLRGPFLLAQAAVRRFVAQGGGGKIVNLASKLGLTALPGTVPYSTSKGAVIQMTRAMAIDVARHGVNVNAVAPGYVPTEGNEAVLARPGYKDWALAHTPLGRFGRPEEIAAAVLYFVSPVSGFATGQVLYVDGGWTVQ